MSFWTHGNFKFRVRGMLSVGDIQKQFGYADSFYDRRRIPNGVIDDEFFVLPSGSEGSFDIYVRKTTKNMTVFYIGGGLRDVCSTAEIEKWFDTVVKRCEKLGKESFYFNDDYKVYSIKGYARADMDKNAKRFSYECNGNWKKECAKDFFMDLVWYVRYHLS